MTHNDIYKKFLIEYDKADVTSSYPSLTEYEAATILDKAYLALIARKLTGNNTRQAPFEYDAKAVEDLRPLVNTQRFASAGNSNCAENEYLFRFADDVLYYLEGQLKYNANTNAADKKDHKNENVIPLNHKLALKFKATNSNVPWIKNPVSFVENDFVHVLIDSYKHKDDSIEYFLATYLKKPSSFVGNLIYSQEESGDDPVNPQEPDTPSEEDRLFILGLSKLRSTDKLG